MERITVGGCQDSRASPQLATVRQPVRQIARIAADLIIQHRQDRRGWPNPMPHPRLDPD